MTCTTTTTLPIYLIHDRRMQESTRIFTYLEFGNIYIYKMKMEIVSRLLFRKLLNM